MHVVHLDAGASNHNYWALERADYPQFVLKSGTTRARLAEFSSVIRAMRPAAIVVPGHASAYARLALAHAIATHTPFVYTADSTAEVGDGPNLRSWLRSGMLRWAYRAPGAFWVPGEASRQFLRSCGVPTERIFEGCYTLDVPRVTRETRTARLQRQRLRASMGIAPDEFVFLFVGELLPPRRVPLLVEVWSSLRARSASLVIVGKGEQEALVRDAITATGARAHLLPPVPYRDLVSLYAMADAYVHPGHEPYSLALVQGALSGLPLIATENVGAAKDVLENGKNGCVVAEADREQLASAMASLQSNPDRAEEMGRISETLATARTPDWAAVQLERAVETLGIRATVR